MKNFIPFFACLSIFCTACQSNTGAPASKTETASPAPPEGWYFQYSKAKQNKGTFAEGNWCQADYSESVVINADRNDYNRRYFILGEGVYKVTITGSMGASSFILRKSGNQSVDLYTSDQNPTCLSSRKNFALKGPSDKWSYDNTGGIAYSVSIGPYEQWARVDILFPPDSGFGMVANRCTNCQ